MATIEPLFAPSLPHSTLEECLAGYENCLCRLRVKARAIGGPAPAFDTLNVLSPVQSDGRQWWELIRELQRWYMRNAVHYNKYRSDVLDILRATLDHKEWVTGLTVRWLHIFGGLPPMASYLPQRAFNAVWDFGDIPVRVDFLAVCAHAVSVLMHAYVADALIETSFLARVLDHCTPLIRDSDGSVLPALLSRAVISGPRIFNSVERWTEERMRGPLLVLLDACNGVNIQGQDEDYDHRNFFRIVNLTGNMLLPPWVVATVMLYGTKEEEFASKSAQVLLNSVTADGMIHYRNFVHPYLSQHQPSEDAYWDWINRDYAVFARNLSKEFKHRLAIVQEAIKIEKTRAGHVTLPRLKPNGQTGLHGIGYLILAMSSLRHWEKRLPECSADVAEARVLFGQVLRQLISHFDLSSLGSPDVNTYKTVADLVDLIAVEEYTFVSAMLYNIVPDRVLLQKEEFICMWRDTLLMAEDVVRIRANPQWHPRPSFQTTIMQLTRQSNLGTSVIAKILSYLTADVADPVSFVPAMEKHVGLLAKHTLNIAKSEEQEEQEHKRKKRRTEE